MGGGFVLRTFYVLASSDQFGGGSSHVLIDWELLGLVLVLVVCLLFLALWL